MSICYACTNNTLIHSLNRKRELITFFPRHMLKSRTTLLSDTLCTGVSTVGGIVKPIASRIPAVAKDFDNHVMLL